jgi:hypothetical protein
MTDGEERKMEDEQRMMGPTRITAGMTLLLAARSSRDWKLD